MFSPDIQLKSEQLQETLKVNNTPKKSNLNLNTLNPQKDLNDSENILEFVILGICQKFEMNPKQAAGILANNFKNFAQIVIRGLKNYIYLPILEFLNNFLMLQEHVVLLIIGDSHSLQFLLNVLRPGLYSASTDVIMVTCKTIKSLLRDLSRKNLQEQIWNYLVMNNGGIGAILNCYNRSPQCIHELVGII